jgi:hypothetical protein
VAAQPKKNICQSLPAGAGPRQPRERFAYHQSSLPTGLGARLFPAMSARTLQPIQFVSNPKMAVIRKRGQFLVLSLPACPPRSQGLVSSCQFVKFVSRPRLFCGSAFGFRISPPSPLLGGVTARNAVVTALLRLAHQNSSVKCGLLRCYASIPPNPPSLSPKASDRQFEGEGGAVSRPFALNG